MTLITKESIKVGDKVARMMLVYCHGRFEVSITDCGEIKAIFEKFEENFDKVMKKYFFTGSKRERYFNDLFGYSERVQLVTGESIGQYTDPNNWSVEAKLRAIDAAAEKYSMLREW